MGRVWESWGPVVLVWALLVPAGLIVIGALVRWRIGNAMPRREALRRSIAEVGAALGTLPWVWMILTPTGGERAVSLVPLRDLVDTLGAAPSTILVQVGANVAVFVPLGFLLPLRFPRWSSVARMTLVGAGTSATLELAQYVLDLGRVSSIDDVLMNAAGAGLGALLAAWHQRRRAAGLSHSDRLLTRYGWAVRRSPDSAPDRESGCP
ncbi:VanZ family protein [Nocardia sp. SSK8]|uniref:VanZ family protein n=1 Tax=Nocardia sp. SSK8 TaxID=3120154 RepID=UPI003008C3EF